MQTAGGRAHGSATLWLKGALFTLLVPMVLGLVVPLQFDRDIRPFTLLWFASWPFLIAGVVFYGSCLVQFLKAGGTPAIFFTRPLQGLIGREPDTLVRGGLYRATRNPMYVGVVTAVVGQALLFRSIVVALYGAGLWTCFHAAVVFSEEPHLRARYGDPYAQYCRAVPRWLW